MNPKSAPNAGPIVKDDHGQPRQSNPDRGHQRRVPPTPHPADTEVDDSIPEDDSGQTRKSDPTP